MQGNPLLNVEGPWASSDSAAVTQSVSSPWPLITSACNKHMSTLVLLRLTRDQRVGTIETAVDVGEFGFFRKK